MIETLHRDAPYLFISRDAEGCASK
jgi:hypothetical protein